MKKIRRLSYEFIDEPPNANWDHITWVSNTRENPTHFILCKVCNGIILFSKEELDKRKAQPTNTSTPCRFDSYHPLYPPEPLYHMKVVD